MREFVPHEILGWKQRDTVETYDRETIFDYINGAGEVYRSYGFRKVTVFRLAKPEEPDITVELFDMGSAEDAYGIFSHARGNEEMGIGEGYEYEGSLLSFWRANFFVCVLAQQESPKTKQAVFALARKISEQLPASGGKPELVSYLPEEGLTPGNTRFFHLHTSLNYHYFLANRNILNLSPDTRAVLARYEPGPTYLLCVKYPSVQQADQARSQFVENYVPEAQTTGAAETEQGKWVAVGSEREYVIIALDAATEVYARHLIKAFADRLSGSNR